MDIAEVDALLRKFALDAITAHQMVAVGLMSEEEFQHALCMSCQQCATDLTYAD
jgi:hypothetical protein